MSLPRIRNGTRIVPLTLDLANALHGDADHALNGNGTCTRENMHVSCFAAERCANGCNGRNVYLHSLLEGSYYAFVCIDDTDATLRFVGCVSASLCSREIAELFSPSKRPDGLMLFNLCVDNRYRRQGVGARLMDCILQVGRKHRLPVFLLVTQGFETEGACNLVFSERVPRLREMYTRNGWEEHSVCDKYILFRHSSTASAVY